MGLASALFGGITTRRWPSLRVVRRVGAFQGTFVRTFRMKWVRHLCHEVPGKHGKDGAGEAPVIIGDDELNAGKAAGHQVAQ